MITYSSRVHLVLHGTNPSGLLYFTKETQGMLLDEALRAEIFVHCLYLGKSETAGISAPYVFSWPNTYCYINTKHCRGPQTVGPPPQSNHYRWQGWITWKVSLYCFQSSNIYSAGRIFPSFSKNNMYLQWLEFSRAAGGIRPAAEVLQDNRSKIPWCLENASCCISFRYTFFSNETQTTTWSDPQIWHFLGFSLCQVPICFSSTSCHCLRDAVQRLLFKWGEKNHAPVFNFTAWVPSQRKSPTSLRNVLSPSLFKKNPPCRGKPTSLPLPKAVLPKVSSLEHSWVQWLQMARFNCSGVGIQGFA